MQKAVQLLLFASLWLGNSKGQIASIDINPADLSVGLEPIYSFEVSATTPTSLFCIRVVFDQPTFQGAAKGIDMVSELQTELTAGANLNFVTAYDVDATNGLYFTARVSLINFTQIGIFTLSGGSILNPSSAIQSTYQVFTSTSFNCGCCFSVGSNDATIGYQPADLVFNTDVSINLNSNVNGAMDQMTFSIGQNLAIPPNGYITISMPKLFVDAANSIRFATLVNGDYSVTSVTDFGGTDHTGTMVVSDSIQPSSNDPDVLEIQLPGGVLATASPVTVVVTGLHNPYSLNPLTPFIISTQTDTGVDIEQCDDAQIVTSVGGTMTSASMTVSDDTVGATGLTYTFDATAINPIPAGGSLWVDYTGSTATFTSTNACVGEVNFFLNTRISLGGCTVDTATASVIKYNGLWTNTDEQGRVFFTMEGWTNPATDATQTIKLQVYDNANFLIDEVEVTFTAQPVDLTVINFEPSDGDWGVNNVPDSYNIEIKLEADILSTYKIRITFPTDYYQFNEDVTSCDAENFEIGDAGDCTITMTTVTDSDNNKKQNSITMVVESFTNSNDGANTNYEFTLTDVRNPFRRYVQIDNIMFEILDASNNAVQRGFWTIGKFQVKESALTDFDVTPASYVTGQITEYLIKVKPVGFVPQEAIMYLYYPDDVNPAPSRLLKDRCGQSTSKDFPKNDAITCKYRQSENLIIIEDGFNSWMSDDFPTLEFDLPVVRNPRSTQETSAFRFQVFDDDLNLLYYWNTTTSPTVRMTTAGPPTQIYFTRETRRNGERNTYTFYVKNAQAYNEGDTVFVTLPTSMNYTAESTCTFTQGFSSSTNCQVRADYQTVYFTIDFETRRRLQTNGEVGSKWVFEITDVRNPYSLQESESITYLVQNADGYDIESETALLTVQNEVPGLIEYQSSEILPDSFDRSVFTNYTLYFEPINFETGMQLTITIPEDLGVITNEAKSCTGIQGLDTLTPVCVWDLDQRTVTFSSAWDSTYYKPDAISLKFGPLLNPAEKLLTASFDISTQTKDGYALDNLDVNLQVNFACKFPCATCRESSDSKCTSCYSTADYRYLYSANCYANCPSGTYATELNTCAKCSSNCKTCEGTADYCTSCEAFFYLNKEENKCETASFYPFPFIIGAFLMTIATSLTILVKRETKFRESVVALLSWVEIALWLTCCILMGGTQQILVILAFVLHLAMNGFFGVVHEKHIFPKSDAYYQEVVMTDNKKHARFVIISSFIFTFKFQHILLSNFGQIERYSGDFSRDCWQIWNKFVLLYILFIYPLTIIAGILAIIQPEGPLDGFIGIELLVVSGYMSFLLLVCLKAYIGTFGPCAKMECCKRYFTPKGEYEPRKRPPKKVKDQDYDAFGPNDSKAELMDQLKHKSPLQTPGEEQKDDIYPKPDEYQIKVSKRESERLDQDSEGEQISEPKMLERMKKERKRLKMLKEQLHSEQKLKKNEQSKLIKETKKQVEIKERTGHKAHGIDNHSSQVKTEHKGLTIDRQEFLEEMDRRIEKKLEEWAEIQSVRHMLKREGTQSSLLSNNMKEISHLASPEKSVYDDERNGGKNRTQDLHGIKKLNTEDSNISPELNASRKSKNLKSSMKASPYHQGASTKIDKNKVHDQDSIEKQSNKTFQSRKSQKVAPDLRDAQGNQFDRQESDEEERERSRKFDQVKDARSIKSNKSGGRRQNEPTDEDEIIRREMEEQEMKSSQSPTRKSGKDTNLQKNGKTPQKGSPLKNQDNQSEHPSIDPRTGEPSQKGQRSTKAQDKKDEPFPGQPSPNAKDAKSMKGQPLRENPVLDAARGDASTNNAKSLKGKGEVQNPKIDPVTGEPTEDNRTIHGARQEKELEPSGIDDIKMGEDMDQPIEAADLRKSSNSPAKRDQSPLSKKGGQSEKSVSPSKKSMKAAPGESDKKNPLNDEDADRDSLKGGDSPKGKKKKNKRVVIYSDKSESSIEELMEDTPSNYNIPNGRLDGKSIGLKAIFMHAQKMGLNIPEAQAKQLEERQKNNLESVQEAPNEGGAAPRRNNALNNLSHLADSSDASWQPGNRRFNGGIDETINSNMDGESVEQNFGKKKKAAPALKQFQEPPHNRGQSNNTTLQGNRNSISMKAAPLGGAKTGGQTSSRANGKGAQAMKKNNFL